MKSEYSVYCPCPNTQGNLYKLYHYRCVIRKSDLDKAFVNGDLNEKAHYSNVYRERKDCNNVCYIIFILVVKDCAFCKQYFGIMLPATVFH